ncbi:hypothetical protein L7F22_057507 [Adiantum nelumboides]|nr:hypothetical protein [Adiantum nelumboides]
MGQAHGNILVNWLLLMLVVCACGHIKGTNATWISFINTCKQPVWPASQPNAGMPVLGNGADGFKLAPRERRVLELPAAWVGPIWGRTGCNFSKPMDGMPKCLIGDCGGGSLNCGGAGNMPLVTIFELTLIGFGSHAFYDVSLVDGYNLPMMALPAHGTNGSFLPTECLHDINSETEPRLSLARVLGRPSPTLNAIAQAPLPHPRFVNPRSICASSRIVVPAPTAMLSTMPAACSRVPTLKATTSPSASSNDDEALCCQIFMILNFQKYYFD